MKKNEVTSLSTEEVFNKLSASASGLSEEEAKNRISKYGKNSFQKNRNVIFDIFVNQFKSSLIYLLIVAALLAFFLLDFTDGIIIFIILFFNAFLGFFQEYRSEKAVEKLSGLLSKQVLVIRGGEKKMVDETLLVPGDIVLIREGDIIAADIKLIEANDLSVNESQLTGESVSLVKAVDGKEADATLLFAGSVVEKGGGEGVVYATGNDTGLGKIAALSQTTKKVTQYEKSLRDFSNFLIRIILFVLAVVFIGKLLVTHDFSHITLLLLFIIALAIAVIPEALPAVATVTLSEGAIRLAKKHVVVKRLSSIEDLGNVNLLCTDKTGTLTENILKIIDIFSDNKELFETFAYASIDTFGKKKKKITDAFDIAFSNYVSPEIKKATSSFVQLKELPFDPSARRKWVILQNTKDMKTYLVEIGSAESLLEIAISNKKDAILKTLAEDGKQGIRHLAIAYKEITYTKDFDILKNENGLLFLGCAKMVDPIRPTAKETIKLAETLGVGIKILTGDSTEVARYVGLQVGLLKEHDRIYTGEEFDALSAEEKNQAVIASAVFSRVTPEQKYEIIQLLKNTYIVGYQGDGINDAPSLKLADVAIAVNNATDVAKDSADIILLKKDLGVVISGIEYGRSIFVNVNKYIKHTMVGNFGNFISIAILYLVAANLPQLPIQLLLGNILTDIPLISVYSDNVDTSEVQEPEKYNIRPLMLVSIILGTFTAVFSFVYFTFVGFSVSPVTETELFLFLTITQLIIIFSVRNKKHMWQGKRPSSLILVSVVGFILLAFAITYIPITAKLFSFVSLSASSIFTILAFSVVYIFLLDAVKVYYFSLQDRTKRKISQVVS
jgi:Mg2+-importing ATPase